MTTSPLVGAVVERPTNRSQNVEFKPLNSSAQKTGFPPVKHRSTFARNRQIAVKERPQTVPTVAPVAVPKPSQDWREEISRENEARVADMTDEDRERARQEIIERFGHGLSEVLRKSKAARIKTDYELDEVPVSAESPIASPKLPSSPIRPSISLENSRPATPTKSARKLRFAELTPTDVHVYESAPPSPRKKTLLALPPPPAEGGSDIISLDAKKFLKPAEGTPEDIRQRFFPSEPKDNPGLEWMSENQAPVGNSDVVRFDLSGRPIPQSLSQTLPTHLGLHHHAEGAHAGYTLEDIFLLVRSRVPAQRSAMLGILFGIAQLLHKERDPAFGQLYNNVPTTLKQILFAGLEALGEKGSVGALAVQVIWACIVKTEPIDLDTEYRYGGSESLEEDKLISSLQLDIILPQITKVLTHPPVSQTLDLLLSLLQYLARHANSISNDMVQTQGLIGTVVDACLFTPLTKPNSRALDFLLTLVSASRLNAKALVDLDIHNVLLRFLVPTVTDRETTILVEKTLRVYVALGRYGMGAGIVNAASEVWRRTVRLISDIVALPTSTPEECGLVETWANLMEIWIVCATDPHCTTPDHDILWSQVVALGWIEDLVSIEVALRPKLLAPPPHVVSMMSAVWSALAAWLEGCRLNAVRGGEKERTDILIVLAPGFNSGAEAQVVQTVTDSLLAGETVRQHTDALTSIIRLWLASAAGEVLPSPPFDLPYSRLSELCARLLPSPVWSDNPILRRPFSCLLHQYLELLRRLPDTTQDIWMAQAFSIVPRMQVGDETYANGLVNELVNMVTPQWANTRQINVANEIWTKGGVGVILPFFKDVITGRSTMAVPNDEDESIPISFITPLVATTQSIMESTTQRLARKRAGGNQHGCYGLPLRRDWMLSPLDCLLKLTEAVSVSKQKELLVPSPWAASETDVVRATCLFARIAMVSLTQLSSASANEITPSSDEIVFDCMKIFMLEHGLQGDEVFSGEEVFRDVIVSSLMERLLLPFTFASAAPSLSTCNLEDVAVQYLGPSTPFYQFYTDFVALYDAISYSHPLFSRLLLPPTSMKYSIDYRRHLWNDFGHLLKNLRTPIEQVITNNLVEYLWPIETDPQIISAYLKALVKVPGLQGFVRFIAIHHVASMIWDTGPNAEGAAKLLTAIVDQCGPDVVRDVILYHQDKDNAVQTPPSCFQSPPHQERQKRQRLDILKNFMIEPNITRVVSCLSVP